MAVDFGGLEDLERIYRRMTESRSTNGAGANAKAATA